MSVIPKSIGAYEVLREIGRGGMGVVYLGRDGKLERDVAIKVLPEDLGQDPERLARFEREAQLLASLHHSNIAAVYGLEEIDGVRYLVLEYVDGEDLSDRMRLGPLPVDEALHLGGQIAAAVGAAHDKGVIHRDLNPPTSRSTMTVRSRCSTSVSPRASARRRSRAIRARRRSRPEGVAPRCRA